MQRPFRMFPMALNVLLLMEAKNLIFQVVGLNIDLCCHRSAVRLCDLSEIGRFDDGAGHRFLWRLFSRFSYQLPEHIQQVKRFRNLGRSLEVDWRLRLLALSSRGIDP